MSDNVIQFADADRTSEARKQCPSSAWCRWLG